MPISVKSVRIAVAAGALGLLAGSVGHSAPGAASGPQRVDDFELSDQNYIARHLYKMASDKAVVLISYAAGDPAFRADAPAYAALKAAYADKGVEFLIIDPRLGDTREKLDADKAAAGLGIPVLFDYEQLVGENLSLTRAAEVLVVNPRDWSIAFRGPVASGSTRRALDSLIAGQPVGLAAQTARGGAIAYPPKASFAQISYAKDIAPIVQEKCAVCHQPGGLGPMTLTSYDRIKAFSPMIREVLRTHRMPPFQPDPTVGHWAPDEGLSPDQLKTLVHWIEAGSPRGPGEDPLAKVDFHAQEWPLGKPDVILPLPAVDVPATGVIPYHNPVVATNMEEGRWMKASAFVVTDRKVLHHVTTILRAPNESGQTVALDPGSSSVGGQGPGRIVNLTPPDMGVWIPAKSIIAFQTHYTPYGKPTTEATKMGLYFYPKGQEPKYPMRTYGVYDNGITIPAGVEFHPESAYTDIPKDMLLYGLTAHAHVRGGSTQIQIQYPDGHKQMVLAVPRYDFNWQCEFYLKEPIMVPAGSRIINTWTYDNSTRNPGNPDPKRVVPFGEQTPDEMLVFFLHYRWVGETTKNPRNDYDKLLSAGQLMGVLDDNMDGKLQLAELRGTSGANLKSRFAAVDLNGDGALDKTEIAASRVRTPGDGGPRGAPATPAPAAAVRPVASAN